MKSSAGKIHLETYDSLLNPESDREGGAEKVQEIPLLHLYPFKNHPFKVLDDQAMRDMVESILKYGILVPGIVRPISEDGGYELIAGHRRKHGLELAGIATMPVLVREMNDDEAVIFMVDSNIQRENLLPSEKARAYKMKLEAMNHQGVKDASRQVGGKCSVDKLSENSDDSARNIHRYIRLTELISPLLDMVDNQGMAFNAAVHLSYLTAEEQGWLLETMKQHGVSPTLAQAEQLKKDSQSGKLDKFLIGETMAERAIVPGNWAIKAGQIRQYFPKTYTKKQMEDVLYSLLEAWRAQNAPEMGESG